jgi:hypothetical protein
MDYVTKAKEWAQARATEISTLDGTVLVAAGIGAIVLKPVMGIIGIGAIAYGAWRIFSKES